MGNNSYNITNNQNLHYLNNNIYNSQNVAYGNAGSNSFPNTSLISSLLENNRIADLLKKVGSASGPQSNGQNY